MFVRVVRGNFHRVLVLAVWIGMGLWVLQGSAAQPKSTVSAKATAESKAAESRKKAKELEETLRKQLKKSHITFLNPGPAPDPAKVALGRMLFFDRELSGNRDVSCATCHHPSFITGDGLSVSIGVGGEGLGSLRILGEGRKFIPRNAIELFNRGSPEWRSQFWDSRVSIDKHGLHTPAHDQLPPGLDGLLAAQAMFPVTSRDEMRGAPGESDLSDLADSDFTGMWAQLTDKVLQYEGYQDLFADAYPNVPLEEIGFEHAANALAAFEIFAYTMLDSPFDQYLAGNSNALTDAQKRGALVFYNTGHCADCHSGNLMTDQEHYNLGVPQIGDGKGAEAPQDFGRARETHKKKDMYAFRTPPLRNVAATGPWMHNGCFMTLEAAVRHHLDPVNSCLNYDVNQLRPDLPIPLVGDPDVTEALLDSADIKPFKKIHLSEEEIADLLAFLESLTSPSLPMLLNEIPEEVPSGLTVEIAD